MEIEKDEKYETWKGIQTQADEYMKEPDASYEKWKEKQNLGETTEMKKK